MLRKFQKESIRVSYNFLVLWRFADICTAHSEKAKQKIREEKWQQLREAAIKNRDSSLPLPASLLYSVAPEGTYNPQREAEREREMDGGEVGNSSYEVEEDVTGPLSETNEPQHYSEPSGVESDDGHADLVSILALDVREPMLMFCSPHSLIPSQKRRVDSCQGQGPTASLTSDGNL